MNVLVACEESQRVTIELRKRGHNAFSCDILEPSGGHPEWHIKANVLPLIDGMCEFKTMDGKTHKLPEHWDLIIAFPPCTYLSNAGVRHYSLRVNSPEKVREREKKRAEAAEFFLYFTEAMCDHIAIENPVGYMNRNYRKPDQIIEPYYFGDPYKKRTCLWLFGLPKLEYTKVLEKPGAEYIDSTGKPRYYTEGIKGVKDRQRERSKTFPGIAAAMADQWTR